MRLTYLANNRIPSEKANSLQIMQSCAAFQRQGADVTLVVPHRMQPKTMRGIDDPFAYYSLETRFPIRRLHNLDTLEIAPARLQPAAFNLQSATFGISAALYLASHRAGLCYTRDPLSMALLAMCPPGTRLATVYEAHTFPKPGPRRSLHLLAARRLGAVVCITHALAREYLVAGVDPKRVIVAPDAVDLARFSNLPDRLEARRALAMPLDARVVCYTGHLYAWKGAHILAKASRHLPDGYLVYIVGGTAEDLAAFRQFLNVEGAQHVRLVGHVPPDRVPAYLAASDVLALPNSGASETSARFTSPMKLFEYMAAGRPIVASRLPSIQEVLRDGENALLVPADDPEALAQGILALEDAAVSAELSAAARNEVRKFTWDTRARTILDALGSINLPGARH